MPVFLGRSPQHRHSTPGLGYRAPLAHGEAGTAQTIAVMRRLVDQALNDQSFIAKAMQIVRPAQAYDELAELNHIFNWVKTNIRFTKDPVTKEKIYPPAEVIKARGGD